MGREWRTRMERAGALDSKYGKIRKDIRSKRAEKDKPTYKGYRLVEDKLAVTGHDS
jgi:hypothetical protein